MTGKNEPIYSFQGNYFFLSNFSPSSIRVVEIVYPTVEHAFQAMKTVSDAQREYIAGQPTPAAAKREGRRVELRPDWDDIKVDVMRTLLQVKFAEPTLGAKLLATDGHQLVEGNTWGDTFWGVCRGQGRNQLGILLMEVRDEVREVLNQARSEGLWDKWKQGQL